MPDFSAAEGQKTEQHPATLYTREAIALNKFAEKERKVILASKVRSQMKISFPEEWTHEQVVNFSKWLKSRSKLPSEQTAREWWQSPGSRLPRISEGFTRREVDMAM